MLTDHAALLAIVQDDGDRSSWTKVLRSSNEAPARLQAVTGSETHPDALQSGKNRCGGEIIDFRWGQNRQN